MTVLRMSPRFIATLTVSASIVLAGSLSMASPAQAVSSATVTVSSGLVATPTSVNLVAGDTLMIDNQSFSGLALKNGTGQAQNNSSTACTTVGATSPGSACPVTSSASSSFTVLATGTFELYRFTSSAVLLATITVGSGGGGTVGDSVPSPVTQQFGLPSMGTCGEVAPISLNWGGASGAGWGNSWAQWVNGGRGGAVCTRTLIYSNALGHWIVG